MFEKCPGQDRRKLKAEIIRCACGYDVEIFSDEMKRACPKCAKTVVRTRLPSCVQWCASAEQCMGFSFRKKTGSEGE